MTFRKFLSVVVFVLNVLAVAYFGYVVYQEVVFAIYNPGIQPFNETMVNIAGIAIVLGLLNIFVHFPRRDK